MMVLLGEWFGMLLVVDGMVFRMMLLDGLLLG